MEPTEQRRGGVDREALRRSYRRVFAGPEGARVLEDLARRGFVRASTFHPEPGRAAFNEGRRSLALEVLALAEDGTGSGMEQAMASAGPRESR